MMERVILHADMNNFYASVECMKNPELKQYPIAVCGDVEERHGIVLAKNGKAKFFGVSTGEAIWQAKMKCPNLVIVSPDHEEYAKFSRYAREIYNRYTDQVEPFGLDECWLDVTGSTRLFGSGEKMAYEIKEMIKRELGITASVGVSFNKIFAKLASDMKKPDAVTVIPQDSFKEKIWHLPASDMLGVGRKTYEKLCACGIRTIGQMATMPMDFFQRKFGKVGVDLWKAANGLDTSEVVTRDMEMLDKSCGHGITTSRDLVDSSEVWKVMLELSQNIGHRLYIYNRKAAGVSVSIRDNTLYSKQWQTRLPYMTQSPLHIAKEAFSLFEKNYLWQNPIRSVTVRAIDLASLDAPEQFDLFFDTERLMKSETLDKTVEGIRSRYGKNAIRNAVLINNTIIN